MKTPHSTVYRYTAETIAAANKLTGDTVDEHAHKRGMLEGEPLTVIFDALHKYAEAYRIRFESPLADDKILGDAWLESLRAVHALLDGDGVNAMKRGITTDSKCNGACETVYWSALAMAGFTEEAVA